LIRRRALAAGIKTKIGRPTPKLRTASLPHLSSSEAELRGRIRATGITAYLENGGTLEHAQQIAAHESPRTTKLYDRTSDQVALDEIERIAI
jgi:hypothetical protein